jgi:hypothetical protein
VEEGGKRRGQRDEMKGRLDRFEGEWGLETRSAGRL